MWHLDLLVFVFLFVIVRYLADLKILWRAPYRPRVSPRNRANPRPSYAKDEPRWGEKEFGRNNVLKPFLGYVQKICTSRQKVTQIRKCRIGGGRSPLTTARLDLVYHQDPGILTKAKSFRCGRFSNFTETSQHASL